MNNQSVSSLILLKTAFSLVRPAISGLIKEGRPNQTDWAVALYSGPIGSVSQPLTSITEEQFTVYTSGDASKFAKPFIEYAVTKAWLTAAFGLPTRVLQSTYSNRILAYQKQVGRRFTSFFGSAIHQNDVVACSGANPNIDEAIGMIVLNAKHGVGQQREGVAIHINEAYELRDGFYVT